MHKKKILFCTLLFIGLAFADIDMMQIELDITCDYQGERVDPEIVHLDGRDVRENFFLPGKYLLDIQHPGFESVSKEIHLVKEAESIYLKEFLITKKRLLKIDIESNPAAPENIPPCKITLAPLDKPEEIREVKAGDWIKPNSYLLKITRDNYETIEKKQNIWPDERPFTIREVLNAELVNIDFKIVYDIPPLEESITMSDISYNGYGVGFVGLHYLFELKKARPGNYSFGLQQPGYNSIKKDVFVPVMEGTFVVYFEFSAKKNYIAFQTLDPHTNILVKPLDIIDLSTDQRYDSTKTYLPRTKMAFRLKFHQYATQNISVEMGCSDDVFIISVPMVKLQPFQVILQKHKVVIDGVKYNYKFMIDEKIAEAHLVSYEKQDNAFLYSIMLPPSKLLLRIIEGYTYRDYFIDTTQKPCFVMKQKEHINIDSLVSHLKIVTKQDNMKYTKALKILKSILIRPFYREMLRECSKPQLDFLSNFVKSWKLESHGWEKVCKQLQQLDKR